MSITMIATLAIGFAFGLTSGLLTGFCLGFECGERWSESNQAIDRIEKWSESNQEPAAAGTDGDTGYVKERHGR